MKEDKRILIIDDNEDDRLIIGRILNKTGYKNLLFAETGEEGVKKAKLEKLNLVVTDTLLPGIDGFEVCRQLRESKGSTIPKVIIMTGLTNAADAVKASHAGADDYIAKTGDGMPLIEAVKKLGGYNIMPAPAPADDLPEQINALRERYAEKFPKRIKEIEETWNTLDNNWNKEAFKGLYHLFHKLAGSSRTFGFTTVANAVQPLEILLKSIIERNTPLTAEEQTQISTYLVALKQLSVKFDQDALTQKRDEHTAYQPSSQWEKTDTEKLTVLMIEDDEELAYLLDFLLKREGFETLVAHDGNQALGIIDKVTPPKLVLSDLMLPYVDGFQLITHIRSKPEWHNVPIIVLSSKLHEQDIVRALNIGANDYILKPFQPAELITRLRRFLRQPK